MNNNKVGFSFGVSIKKVTQSAKPELFPGIMTITLQPLGTKKSRRQITFNALASTTLKLNAPTTLQGDKDGETTNKFISTSNSYDETTNEVLHRFIFVSDNITLPVAKFLVAKSNDTFSNQDLYTALLKQYNLDQTVENTLQIVEYSGTEIPEETQSLAKFYVIQPIVDSTTDANEGVLANIPVGVDFGQKEELN